MKIIAVNGSPRRDGNTTRVLQELAILLMDEGIETEILHIGGLPIHGCIGCNYCHGSHDNLCVFTDDAVNDSIRKLRAADGIILASPTYYAGIAGTMKCFLDRVFYTSSGYFRYKAATALAVVRRAGGVAVADQLIHYLNLAETVLPPTQYWPVVYGRDKGEALQDAEGMQTVSRCARSMAWLMKVLDSTRETLPPPEFEDDRAWTSFIR